MILTTTTANGERITYDTAETLYHVKTAFGWIGEVRIDVCGRVVPANHPTNPTLRAYTKEQPMAHLFSRGGALKCAAECGGIAYRVTRTGKLQPIRSR
jgi:hypothetical protein